jgi:imidazolonepropionase-like amidohydrolase
MRSVVAALILSVLWRAAPAPSQTMTPQLIQDVQVFDGERVLQHRSVLIENGKISRIAAASFKLAGATLVDGRGKTLLPGLFDAHVHMPDKMEDAARQALEFGVTTQLDMFNGGERLKKIKQMEAEDRPDLADVRTAGIGATVPGGHPSQLGGGSIPTVSKPDDASAFVDARIAEGSDYIKIIHDDGSTWPWAHKPVSMLDTPTMRAVVEAAHTRGKLAVVHILSEPQARDAIEAGADGLVHIFEGEPSSPDFGRLAVSHRVFVIPTLSTIYADCGKSDAPDLLADPDVGPYIHEMWRRGMLMAKPDPSQTKICKSTDDAIHQLITSRVPLLVGTDAPTPGTTYGASAHGEMTLLVQDGLTPIQALAAATSVPARMFRLEDRGRIREGLRADLVLVRGDPTTNIFATRQIVEVWKKGVPVQRGKRVAEHR